MEKENIQITIDEIESKTKILKETFDRINSSIEEIGTLLATILSELIKERDSWMERIQN